MPDETQLKVTVKLETQRRTAAFSFEPQHYSLHIIHGVLGEVLLQ